MADAEGSLGLRERKKRETRLAISNIATRMFIERGFDRVTLAEVADEANVSVNTIFNYFSTKEELFFDREAEVEDEPARIIRERRVGESAVDALERHFLASIAGKAGLLFKSSDSMLRFLRTVDESPALRARQLVMIDKSERALAAVLAGEAGRPPGDPTARVVAAMMTGILWMLVSEFRSRVLAGEPEKKVRASIAKLGARSFEVLREGAGRYATKGAPRSPRRSARRSRLRAATVGRG